MKTSLGHVRINVSNIIESLKWYEEVLEFERDSCWPPDNPNWYSFKSNGGADFSIMEVDKTSCGRMNFGIQYLVEYWGKIKDKVEVIEPICSTPWGTRKFTIIDLDGNELSFVQE